MYCVYLSLTALLFASGIQCSVNEATFAVEGSLANKVCPVKRKVFEQLADSLLACVRMAALTTNCAGVSYTKEHHICYGCDTSADDSGHFRTMPGTVFYSRQNAYPDGFEDISGFILMIVTEQTSTYDQAHSACAGYSASLVRIDSPQKQAAIRSHLIVLSGGRPLGYWIQCRKDAANGTWKFDDGTRVPTTNTYWYPGQPDIWNQNCGYVSWSYDFMWGDTLCEDPIGYICEINRV